MYNKTFLSLMFMSSIFAINVAFIESAQAQNKIGTNSNSEIYRYTKGGTISYGDKLPNVGDVRVETISKKTGITLETKRYSDNELEEQRLAKEEYELRKIAQDQESEKDKDVLAKYSSIKDIDDRKKFELGKVSDVIQKDITSQVTLEDQKSTLDREIKRNPDNKKRLEIEYRLLERELEKVKNNLEINKNIYFQRSTEFDTDRQRYVQIIENAKTKK